MKDEFKVKEEMDKFKKTNILKNENCETKEYMRKESHKKVRETFRMKLMMINWMKGSYTKRYKEKDLICNGCME